MKERQSFQIIPGIGPSMSQDLYDLGYRSPVDLAHNDPQAMYDRLCSLRGGHVDKCVLYAFRCAVYFCSHEKHDPELLKWWNWKD